MISSHRLHLVVIQSHHCAVVLLLAGAMLGGVLTKDVEVTHTLWVCGAIKAGIVVVLAGWKQKEEESVRLE